MSVCLCVHIYIYIYTYICAYIYTHIMPMCILYSYILYIQHICIQNITLCVCVCEYEI